MQTIHLQWFNFLRIRLLLLYRSLEQAGWGLLLFALVLCMGIIVAFLAKVLAEPQPHWGALLAIPIFLWHFNRRDGRFLRLIGVPFRGVLWAEYAFASIPAAVLLVCADNWKGLIVLLLCIFVLPFLPLPDRKLGDKATNLSLDFLPTWAFEWKAGLRQVGYGIYLCWFVGLAGSFWIGTLPLLAFLWGTLLMSFFENMEPKEILQRDFAGGRGFWRKTGQQILLANAFLLPHALVFGLFNGQYWYFLPAIFGYVSLLTAFSVASKYAAWYPGRRRVRQTVLSGLFIFMVLSAIFTPVSLAWWVWKALAAANNLKKHFANP